MKNPLIIVLLLMVLGSCEKPSGSFIRLNGYQLSANESRKLILDSLANFTFSSSLRFIRNGKEERLVNLNLLNHSLDFYDYSSGQLINRLPLSEDGPNGLGTIDGNMTFLVIEEEVLIFNNWLGYLIVLGPDGVLRRHYDIDEGLMAMGVNTEGSAMRPILHHGNLLKIPLYPASVHSVGLKYNKMPTVLELDLETHEKRFLMHYPEVYDQHFWGLNDFKYSSYFTPTGETDTYLVSFPVSPFLYKYQGDRLIDSLFMPSEYFDVLAPMDDRPLPRMVAEVPAGISMDQSNEYALTHSDYGPLFGLPGSDYYLRMVNYRPNRENYLLNEGEPAVGWIIFDHTGVKLGETRLPEGKYLYGVFFINEQGLHIARTPEREGEIIFDIFSIEPR